MKIKPMIGEFALEGIEYVESSERLALVEHRVPGLHGDYLQQMGTIPNAIVVRGTRFGDDARDDFLKGIRDIFNKAEPTTFVADINTATDITDVLVEDLRVAEMSGTHDVFQYEIRIRKFVKPPEPPKTDLLDTGILGDATSALGALNTLDALSSIPNLGDPTPPLNDSLKSVEGATAALPGVIQSVDSVTKALPDAQVKSDSLAPVLGGEGSGTGVAGALKLLQNLDGKTLSASLSANLGDSFSAKVSASMPSGAAGSVDQVKSAVATIPTDPATLTAALVTKLDGIKQLSTADLAGHLQEGLKSLESLRGVIPDDAYALISDVLDRVGSFKGEFLEGEFSEIRAWSDSVKNLYDELAPMFQGTGIPADQLLDYLRKKVESVAGLLLPNGSSVQGAVVAQIDAALKDDIAAKAAALQSSLAMHLQLAKADFESGNFTNTVNLGNAEADFRQLASLIADFSAALRPILGQDAISPEVVATRLRALYDNFTGINLVDLGNIRDKFASAINSAEEKIRGLNLEAVQTTIQGVFDKIDSTLTQFDLDAYTSKLAALHQQLDDLLQKLDGALLECVAVVRNAFTQVKSAIQSLAGQLGSYDSTGKFHFTVEQEVEQFLQGIRTHLHDEIQPLIQKFKTTVGDALGQVRSVLEAVKGEIDKVQAGLKGSLDEIHTRLQGVDIKGTMAAISQKLNDMLNQLGTTDFDVVVNPVIEEINSLGAALKKIDVSSMNELTVGALKVSLQVVVHINFSAQITQALMAQFDKLLAMPNDALAQAQAKIHDSIQQFGAIAPKSLLAPLDGVFKPVRAELDALHPDNLLKPLDDWYAQLQAAVAQISPAALLKPLIDVFEQLRAAVGAIAPDQLIAPLQTGINDLKSLIGRIDLHGVAASLEGGFDSLIAQLDKLSPAQLLNPLITAFDKIMAALDAFSPASLLKPFNDLFGQLGVVLANLTTEQVRTVSQIFDVLREAIAAFDPDQVYGALRSKFGAVAAAIDKLNVGNLLGSLKTPYDAMNASFVAKGGASEVAVSVRVGALNPLRDPSLGQAISDFQSFQAKLAAMAAAQPPGELVTAYQQIKDKLESLVPVWAKSGISADSVRRAFEAASPLNLKTEIDQLYDTMKQKLRVFDPRTIQTRLQSSFDKLETPLRALDPKKLVAETQALIGGIGSRLDGIDLKLIAQELQSLADEIMNVVSGLDPRPVIAQLQGLTDEITVALAALKPSVLLADLNPLFDTAKSIVDEFDPAKFTAAIQSVFDDIQALLLQIDITQLLSPITDRLKELRDKLEAALQKTETAFNAMLASAPV